MTNCDHILRVHAYHDGELSADLVPALETHLRQCPACAAELAALRKIRGGLLSAHAPTVPADLLDRIHESIDRRADLGVLRLTRWLTAAAAAIVFACLLYLPWAQPSSSAAGALAAWEATAALTTGETNQGFNEEQRLAQWTVDDLSGCLARNNQPR